MIDGFGGLEGLVVVDIDIFYGLAHSGNHRCQVLDVAHLADLLYLIVEVVQVELVLGQFLARFAHLLLVHGLLGLLHEGNHVAHSKDAVGYAVGVEDIQGLHLLARGNELDGLAGYGLDGECGTSAGVTVQFGEHHAVVVYGIVERQGGCDCILAGHGIYHEKALAGLHGLVHRAYLVHQFLVHAEAAGSIDNNYAVSLLSALGDGGFRYLYGIFLSFD